MLAMGHRALKHITYESNNIFATGRLTRFAAIGSPVESSTLFSFWLSWHFSAPRIMKTFSNENSLVASVDRSSAGARLSLTSRVSWEIGSLIWQATFWDSCDIYSVTLFEFTSCSTADCGPSEGVLIRLCGSELDPSGVLHIYTSVCWLWDWAVQYLYCKTSHLECTLDPGRRPRLWLSKKHPISFLSHREHLLESLVSFSTIHFILTRRHGVQATLFRWLSLV